MEQSVSGIGVLDKVMVILSALDGSPAALAELTQRSGIARPTAFRLARGLESHGLLRRDIEGRFALGPALVGLGHSAAEGYPLHQLAAPVVESLRDRTGESAQLYVPDGDMRLCLLALESVHELRTIVSPGARLPLRRGSAGRLLAGEAPGPGGWLETLEERQAGVASVSAPVPDHSGTVVAAISVSGPVERLGPSPGERHGAAVVAAAAEIDAARRRGGVAPLDA